MFGVTLTRLASLTPTLPAHEGRSQPALHASRSPTEAHNSARVCPGQDGDFRLPAFQILQQGRIVQLGPWRRMPSGTATAIVIIRKV
jgi:hypothetical protein